MPHASFILKPYRDSYTNNDKNKDLAGTSFFVILGIRFIAIMIHAQNKKTW